MIIKMKKTYILIAVLLVTAVICSCTAVNLLAVSSRLNSVQLPVVMYHQLTQSESRAGKYILTVEQFEKDLIFLKEKGYQTVTTQQLLEFSHGKSNLPSKPIMLTFDDGCETVYEYALPLLEKYGFTAVSFVIGSVADHYSEIDDHNLNYSNLNWAQIKALCEGNIIDIQSHSYDLHKNTGNRSGMKKKKGETIEQYSEFLRSDMAKMREAMLSKTGETPIAVAYPFGSYSPESENVLKKSGIKIAFTCEERINIIKKAEPDWLFGLGRYNRPNGISSESFFEKMGIS